MKATTLLLAFFTVITALHAQNPESISLDTTLSILNDRAFFRFPAGAVNEKRGVSIMSADPNENVETRIVYDQGEMRIVFYAWDLLSFGDSSLFETQSKKAEEENVETRILTDSAGMQSILMTPSIHDTINDAILINSLIVRLQDNTLFSMDAYINTAASRLKDQYLKLSENVFGTLQQGTRSPDLSHRKEKQPIFATDKYFVFDLPENYCITIDQQYDFQVFTLVKVQKLYEENWVRLIIYTGEHPSLIYKDYGLSQKDCKKLKGEFLGEKADWLLYEIMSMEIFVKEQAINCDNISKGLIVHVAMMSNQLSGIDELTGIVESMKLTK